jgi:transcription antitermination factor NusG
MIEGSTNGTFDARFTLVCLAGFSNQEAKTRLYLDGITTKAGMGINQVLVPSAKVIEIKNRKRYGRVKKFSLGYLVVRMKLYNEEEK